ncbi:hypothetical protein [Metabacillus sp. cB07]|uniref:hypothetical protein n=1 Tax=Metabacillus sp. cB07 TaxID=2806989 RepID=UPI0019398902|nr:hypothetical protein [Metabacillus sp. cB07]
MKKPLASTPESMKTVPALPNAAIPKQKKGTILRINATDEAGNVSKAASVKVK